VLARAADVDVREVPARSLGLGGQATSLQGLRAAMLSEVLQASHGGNCRVAARNIIRHGISFDTSDRADFCGSCDGIVQNNFGL
jgi:hypothetical protein